MKNKRILSPRQAYLKSVKRDKIKVKVLQVSVLVAFLLAWELLTLTGVVDSFFTSSPSGIVKCFISLDKTDLLFHMGVTLYECLLGFALSTIV